MPGVFTRIRRMEAARRREASPDDHDNDADSCTSSFSDAKHEKGSWVELLDDIVGMVRPRYFGVGVGGGG